MHYEPVSRPCFQLGRRSRHGKVLGTDCTSQLMTCNAWCDRHGVWQEHSAAPCQQCPCARVVSPARPCMQLSAWGAHPWAGGCAQDMQGLPGDTLRCLRQTCIPVLAAEPGQLSPGSRELLGWAQSLISSWPPGHFWSRQAWASRGPAVPECWEGPQPGPSSTTK